MASTGAIASRAEDGLALVGVAGYLLFSEVGIIFALEAVIRV